MHKTYGERVEFFVVYVREAHPIDGSAPGAGFRSGPIEDPITLIERKEVASKCHGTLDMSPLKMLIDDMKDSAGTAYAGLPDRLYLIARDGKRMSVAL